MKPRVILHNQVSVDGRIDWFPANIGLHYDVAGRLGMDAHLAGSNTIFNPQQPLPPEDDDAFKPPERKADDRRPLLVVPDSGGRLRNWHVLGQQPYWRQMVALCSNFTPDTYLDYLRRRHVDCIVTGREKVDLPAALEELHGRYGTERVVVDSGGTLNGLLLRAGLVDEVSILVSPHLVGGRTPQSIFRAADLTAADGVIDLDLVHLERLGDGLAWLRYVTRSD